MPSNFQLRTASQIIRHQGIIAYPTESVYGLGCNPLDPHAVMRLLALKQRPAEKGLIIIASHIGQLLPYINIDSQQLKQLTETDNRPITWLVESSDLTPVWIRGQHKKLAVRITQHAIARNLCDIAGQALVSTSANPSQLPPAKTALKVRKYFANEIDFIISGSTGNLNRPTEIRDLETGQVIRPA